MHTRPSEQVCGVYVKFQASFSQNRNRDPPLSLLRDGVGDGDRDGDRCDGDNFDEAFEDGTSR